MKYFGSVFFSLFLFLIIADNATAHVQLDAPNGGEVFTVGDTLKIQWTLNVPHEQNNWDLHFSIDGGVTWDSLAIDLPTSQFEYIWIVPDSITEQGRIRVTMDNVDVNYVASSNVFTIQGGAVSVQETKEIPKSFKLSNNYPNPFNPSTTINYELSVSARVELRIYDISGREVRTLLNAERNPGRHQIEWDGLDNAGKHVASGIYLYELKVGSAHIRKKMILLK